MCRVYDTATHTRLGKLERPASAAADPGAPCSLLWRGGRELLVAWGRQVVVSGAWAGMGGAGPHRAAAQPSRDMRALRLPQVVRVLGTPLPPGAMAAKRSLQIAASFDAGCTALGAATFGADLAVLTWGAPSSSSGGGGGGGGSGGDDGSAVMCTVVCGSTAADELPVSSPVGGAPAADSSASPRSVGSAPAGQQGADGHAADVGQQDADQLAAAGQQRASPLPAQQEQELRLCFFTRAGQLLAADGLSVSVPAGQRRWHHLALLYPGDADLQLEAAVTWRSSIAPPGSLLASPPRSSGPGSVAGSGRSTPAKPAASTPVPGSPRAEASTSGHSAAGSGGGERGAQAAQQAVQQYKWWRDGEEPLYLISGPAVSWHGIDPGLMGPPHACLVPRPSVLQCRCSLAPNTPIRCCRASWRGGRGTAMTACHGWRSGGGIQRRWWWQMKTPQVRQGTDVPLAAGTQGGVQAPLVPGCRSACRQRPCLAAPLPIPAAVHAAVRESVGERFLQALVAEERYGEAAALCPRALQVRDTAGFPGPAGGVSHRCRPQCNPSCALKPRPAPACPAFPPSCPAQDNELAWERWAYTFAQARQLAALAPVLPTDQPRLKPSTYDMVAASLLLHPTGELSAPAVPRWPPPAAAGRCGCSGRAVPLQCRRLPPATPHATPTSAEHEVLLHVVRRWPQAAYNAAQLQAAVLE